MLVLGVTQRYEWIWRTAFVCVLALAAWIMKRVYIFQTHEHFEDIRIGSVMDFLKYSLPFSVAFTVNGREYRSWTC